VREALQERSWWIRQAPQLASTLELLVPIYRNGERAKWLVGTRVYDLLATGSGLPRGRWYSVDEVVERIPGLPSSTVQVQKRWFLTGCPRSHAGFGRFSKRVLWWHVCICEWYI